jgi:predicted ATP-grasp superfamily ATP-dependent carboligase
MIQKAQVCSAFRTQLAQKQYQLSKTNYKKHSDLIDILILNQHIKELLKVIKSLNCEGADYLGKEPKITRKKLSTKLKLNRELDPKKLFIPIKSNLPPKKRLSLRK